MRKQNVQAQMHQNYITMKARVRLADQKLKDLHAFDPLVANHYWRLHLTDMNIQGKKPAILKVRLL